MAGKTLLDIRGVHTYYGNIRALNGVDVTVEEGEIVALIGANGAGKSTLMMTIFGAPKARSGSIVFAGTGGGLLAASQANREREQLIQRYVVSIDPHQQVNAPR